mmetsp:Transcript_596/g.1065  ORF Transcript_596/g.1065 Transcript_596/m.1065 type:complete len:118 (+) Transcript_596:103-456(+)
MMAVINGTQEKGKTTAEKINDIIDDIAKTRQQVGLCKDDLHMLVEKKRAIKVGPGGLDNKKKRAKVVKGEIAEGDTMLKTLQDALYVQQKELEKLNPRKSCDNVAHSDGTSSGYESS